MPGRQLALPIPKLPLQHQALKACDLILEPLHLALKALQVEVAMVAKFCGAFEEQKPLMLLGILGARNAGGSSHGVLSRETAHKRVHLGF